MKSFYVTDRDGYFDFDVRFIDIDKAIEYARWKGYSKLAVYKYDRYSHEISLSGSENTEQN